MPKKLKYTYSLLNSSEVDGKGALISSRAKGEHGNVGSGRNHNEACET